jgi:hypothetical protein
MIIQDPISDDLQLSISQSPHLYYFMSIIIALSICENYISLQSQTIII